MRIADVSAHFGFADQSHFCRIFKAETGLAPSAYRSLLA
jgi:AraC-like DNA-binding protein